MAGIDNDTFFGVNVDFSGAATPAPTMLTNGQILIASTALNGGGTHINVGTLTSPLGTIAIGYSSPNITIDASGSGTIMETLSDDVGVKALPSGNNIQLVGHVNEQGATKFSTTVAGTNLININPMSSARWIVDGLGFNGTHTTIGSALTSATSGDTIIILPGTYTENITLKAGVNLAAYNGDGDTPTVTINGTVTASFAGTACMTGIHFLTNGATAAITVTGNSATLLNIFNSNIDGASNTPLVFNSSNVSQSTKVINCILSSATNVFTLAGASGVEFRYCIANASTTASTHASSGGCRLFCTRFNNPITSSSTGFMESEYAFMNNANATCLTLGTTSSQNNLYHSIFTSGSASAISIANNDTQIVNCVIDSTNTNAITGAGVAAMGGCVFKNTSSLTNTTTQNPRVMSNDAITIKAPGAYPYTAVPQDAVIIVDTTSARTINLNASPVTGQRFIIKDNTGGAAANNITIVPAAGNIDGAANLKITTNFGSATVVYNGTQWNKI
jgi:hypothetical protein